MDPVPHARTPGMADAFPGRWRTILRRAPPRLGENSAEILAEIGYGAEEIEALCAAGTVRCEEGNRAR